jgi:hypothetical protein
MQGFGAELGTGDWGLGGEVPQEMGANLCGTE